MSNKPIAFAVTIAIDYPDNHADSDFVGLFKTAAEAKQACKDYVLAQANDAFGTGAYISEDDDTDTEGDFETWEEETVSGNYYEFNLTAADGGIYGKVLPIYRSENDKCDEWVKAFQLR